MREQIGLVDGAEVTACDVAERAVSSASLGGAPTGVLNGDYYYDVPLPGLKASGTYFFALHGRASGGTVVRARDACALVR